jgi:hypothetical protein
MRRFTRSLAFVVLLLAGAACGSSAGVPGSTGLTPSDAGATPPSDAGDTSPPDTGAPSPPLERALILLFGDDVLPAVRDRVTSLLTPASPLPVRTGDANALPASLTPDSVILAFGDTAATRSIVPGGDLSALGAEGVIVRSGSLAGVQLIAAAGNDPDPGTSAHGNLGTAYAAYALLEQLGFAFLHPLAPVVPATLAFPASPIDVAESPAWRVRGVHLHTMHPLELTQLLEGFGPGGIADDAGWSARLPEWDSFLEWMLANRQNRVEWALLWASDWADFADGEPRQQRLATLVEHAHARGISVGADAPLALQQQHGYRLVRQTGDLTSEKQQIDQHLDWVFGAGFDYLSTESGTTEFTSSSASETLAWMNEAASYASTAHGAPSYIKAHCSTGQVADGYPDPVTGNPINFNFLPHYADARMGVMPHTVEIYGLDDPAPTYGNTDFGYMKDFLEEEVGAREVLFYPETAYWVTYDIDVPLFLPVYAERRVADLLALQADQAAGKMGRGAHAGRRMDGQLFFSSGWEWGYWLNDVVAARAAYDPHGAAGSSRDALLAILAPVTRALGGAGPAAAAWIADVAQAQRNLLILGEVNGAAPASIANLSGMAYLEGFDATADVGDLGASLGIAASPVTQPTRVGLVSLRNPLRSGPDYKTQIEPLLAEMETTFGDLADRGAALAGTSGSGASDLLGDLADAARMTALRAKQVHGLYDYVAGPSDQARARLQTARDALDAAAAVVVDREKHYRVPADRIAGWGSAVGSNPTAYGFGYLWFARSLYFWWRDEGKAVDAPVDPCYLNAMNPVDIGLGEGLAQDAAQTIQSIVGASGVAACLAAPTAEPSFPQNDLRSRP